MRAIRSERALEGGFTLVELVLCVVLGLVVLLGAGEMYLGTQQAFRIGAHKLVAQQEATLLSTAISRNVRAGSGLQIYIVPNRTALADSGDGIAVLDQAGNVIRRVEWSSGLATLVDENGARLTAMKLSGVIFQRDPTVPRALRYSFKTDDEIGDLVDIESAAVLRN